MSGRFDHSTIVVSDLDVSQRLYCDGLGLVPVFDQVAGGDWRRIFGVATDSLRAILLADPNDPSAALLELIVFDDGLDRKTIPKQGAPHRGLAWIAFRCDVEETCARLNDLGYAVQTETPTYGDPPVRVTYAYFSGPDGEMIELIPSSHKSTAQKVGDGSIGNPSETGPGTVR